MSGLMTGGWSRPAAAIAPVPIAPSLLVVVQNALAVAWRALLEEVKNGLFQCVMQRRMTSPSVST